MAPICSGIVLVNPNILRIRAVSTGFITGNYSVSIFMEGGFNEYQNSQA